MPARGSRQGRAARAQWPGRWIPRGGACFLTWNSLHPGCSSISNRLVCKTCHKTETQPNAPNCRIRATLVNVASINFHCNLRRPRRAPDPLLLSVTGGNFPFLPARKKPADVRTSAPGARLRLDRCGPGLHQCHSQARPLRHSRFFLPLRQKRPESVFPTPAPPALPVQFPSAAWPFRGLALLVGLPRPPGCSLTRWHCSWAGRPCSALVPGGLGPQPFSPDA